MIWKRISFVVALLLAASALKAERDSGASYNLLLKGKINDDWFVISRSNLASRNDFDDHFFGYTGAGLGYKLSDLWSIRLGYRHLWFRPQNEWLEANRPSLKAYFAKRFDDFRFTSRSRLKLRLFDYRENYARFRNEFTLEAARPLGNTALRPYLEEEFFYDTQEARFEANWLGGGLAWRPATGVKLKLGYRWNHFRVGNEWRDRDVLVTGLNLFF